MIYLHGLGHFYPENVVTNRFLSDLDIGSSVEWIEERVGIRERHTVLPLEYIRETKNRDVRAAQEASIYTNGQTAAAAARMALERAGIATENIGMVVSGSSAPDVASPAEASTVAAQLGIDVPAFDMNSACTSFALQIHFLSNMNPGVLPPYILITQPENLTRCIDFSDRRSACLFGDGSTAAVVSLTVPSGKIIDATHFDAKPSCWDKVSIRRTGSLRPGRQRRPGLRHPQDNRCPAHHPGRQPLAQRTSQVRRPPGKPRHAENGLRALRDQPGKPLAQC